MEQLITGIHHVTTIAGDAQQNLDFYAGILGLKLVKKTVNFDAREVYHLYYGNEHGSAGNILTSFPYKGLTPGRHGKGMLNTTAFSLPYDAIEFWEQRLQRFDVAYKTPRERFRSEAVIYLEDVDGLGLELVFTDKDKRPGFATGNIPDDKSIRGFHNDEIWEEGYERTAALLTEQMDHQLIAQEGNRFRFAANDQPGHYVDVLCTPDALRGLAGSGTVHHIAFSTPGHDTQLQVRNKIQQRMLNPTPVLDRKYFSSVYFREPGGVLFEIATAGPGFAIDESIEELGLHLQLPEGFEPDRKMLEAALPPITYNSESFK
jgi:glyoxalase family protein